jgi:hypothetical protein
MKTAGLILLFAAIASFDLPSLFRERRKKKLTVYGCIFVLAFVLSELQLLRVPMWSPNRLITDVVNMIIP